MKNYIFFILTFISAITISFHSYSGTKKYNLTDVGHHNTSKSCWVIVDQEVYDLTEYLPNHKRHNVSLDEFCGKDASIAWHTKGDSGRPHSRKSAILLKKYKIGDTKP